MSTFGSDYKKESLISREITKSKDLQIAIHFLDLILGNNGEMTPSAVAELFEIHAGNKEVIKQHLKAIINIMKRALKDLEEKSNE